MLDPRPVPGPQDPLRALAELGLTLSEARAYLALLGIGQATAASLAQQAGIPRAKVYEALRALEERGLCSVSASRRVAEYTPVPPATGLRRWLRQRDQARHAESEREEALVERLIAELPSGPAAEAVEHYMEMVNGQSQTSETLERLIGNSLRTLWMIQQPPFLQPRSRWGVAELAAAGRGVDVRVIFTPAGLADDQRYVPLLDSGISVRLRDVVPMKLLIRDGVEAMVSLRDPLTGKQSLVSAVIHHPDLVGPLALLFEREWEGAQPVEPPESPAATPDGRPTTQVGQAAER